MVNETNQTGSLESATPETAPRGTFVSPTVKDLGRLESLTLLQITPP